MQVGDRYEVCKTVTAEMTAKAVGSGGLSVFGTPFLAAMMENAAFCCLQRDLPDGKSSVGTRIELSHVSPTPIGMEIRVTAEITHISENGRMVDFKVSGYDGAGLIGEGTHQRAIIDAGRFLEKCRAKLNKEV